MSFQATVCPSCHKDIQIPTDVAAPSCPYCGHVFRQEGAAPAATLSALLGLARTALAAGNSQEALEYFNRVLESDPTNSDAWMGKGKAAGWQSSIVNMRLPEMLIAFNHAIANAPESDKEATVRQAVDEANRLTVTLYGMARKHLLEYVSLPNSWPQYIVQVSSMLTYLEEISSWMPTDRTTLENIVHLCKDNIEGVSYRDQFDNNMSKAWTLTPQYEALMKSQLERSADRLRALDPTYSPPAIEKKQADACFIVTAAMGNFDHPTVTLMRRFRDQWIMEKRWGPSFVDLYYRIGPHGAALIERSRVIKMAALVFIINPAAWLAKLILGCNR